MPVIFLSASTLDISPQIINRLFYLLLTDDAVEDYHSIFLKEFCSFLLVELVDVE
jgi:hypothetical protein